MYHMWLGCLYRYVIVILCVDYGLFISANYVNCVIIWLQADCNSIGAYLIEQISQEEVNWVFYVALYIILNDMLL